MHLIPSIWICVILCLITDHVLSSPLLPQLVPLVPPPPSTGLAAAGTIPGPHRHKTHHAREAVESCDRGLSGVCGARCRGVLLGICMLIPVRGCCVRCDGMGEMTSPKLLRGSRLDSKGRWKASQEPQKHRGTGSQQYDRGSDVDPHAAPLLIRCHSMAHSQTRMRMPRIRLSYS